MGYESDNDTSIAGLLKQAERLATFAPEEEMPANWRTKELVLQLIQEHPGITDREALKAAGFSVHTRMSHWRRDDPAFDKRYAQVRRANADVLAAEGERRAMRGSDALLMFLLKAYDKEKFGSGDAAPSTTPSVPPAQAAARLSSLLALAAARKASSTGDGGSDPCEGLA